MADEEVILTREGMAQLEQELEELKSVKRREIAARIKLAISYGDLKENSEYHAAKDDQAFMETRIAVLERMLTRAKVTDASSVDLTRVHVGCTVVLNDVELAETMTYRIVGPAEADVFDNKISYESPLGTALMDKKVGEIIRVAAPDGLIEYELLEIRAIG